MGFIDGALNFYRPITDNPGHLRLQWLVWDMFKLIDWYYSTCLQYKLKYSHWAEFGLFVMITLHLNYTVTCKGVIWFVQFRINTLPNLPTMSDNWRLKR